MYRLLLPKIIFELPEDGQSQIFKANLVCWKIFGLWSDETSSRLYKCFSASVLIIFWLFNWIFMTLSLWYAPKDVDTVLNQSLYYFLILAAFCKMHMIIFNRNNILKLFVFLDSGEFSNQEEVPRQIIQKNKYRYDKLRKLVFVIYSTGLFSSFLPVFTYLFSNNSHLELPIYQFYFLNETTRKKYFLYILAYQYCILFILINHSLSIDTFAYGMIMIAITQYKILNWKLLNLKLRPSEATYDKKEQEVILKDRLNMNLKYYDAVLRYREEMEKLISQFIFAHLGNSGLSISIAMALAAKDTLSKKLIYMVLFLMIKSLILFIPTKLGTELTQESENLVFSAYCSDWISRPESFKRSLRLLMQHANKPFILTGFKTAKLSVVTFTSIINTSYSLFTLFRNVDS